MTSLCARAWRSCTSSSFARFLEFVRAWPPPPRRRPAPLLHLRVEGQGQGHQATGGGRRAQGDRGTSMSGSGRATDLVAVLDVSRSMAGEEASELQTRARLQAV
jgi:hypothetical protein